jgi:hypothetical protein
MKWDDLPITAFWAVFPEFMHSFFVCLYTACPLSLQYLLQHVYVVVEIVVLLA